MLERFFVKQKLADFFRKYHSFLYQGVRLGGIAFSSESNAQMLSVGIGTNSRDTLFKAMAQGKMNES